MKRVNLWAVAVSLAMLLASCGARHGPSVSPSDPPGSSVVPSGTTEHFTPDSIPVASGAADRGCLDESGTLRANAGGWYVARSAGSLSFTGERGSGAALDSFVKAAKATIAASADGFVLDRAFELRQTADGCATYRSAVFVHGEDNIVVSAWRVVAAADPFWVASEATFTAEGDHTLVSRGEHIAVVLAVSLDGTTSRVSAYGNQALQLVSGWPSTTARPPSAGPLSLGPSPMGVDDMLPLANSMLRFVLSQR